MVLKIILEQKNEFMQQKFVDFLFYFLDKINVTNLLKKIFAIIYRFFCLLWVFRIFRKKLSRVMMFFFLFLFFCDKNES